ncbi:MAG: hypothetical protein Q8M98_05605 [Candidatus Cloacimonadaceae bacterium]|nr:hypothetical protein [Candidatus Cloacimonadaceae bacterium]MDP3114237.1 hypothetical protein [Candidatus Cloacimonadaceae bacterium]
MKVTIKAGIMGLAGEIDGAIYYYHPRLKRTLMRSKPKMPKQAINDKYRKISKALKAINPSELFKADFKIYISVRRDTDDSFSAPGWYCIWVKMMWAMQRKYPDLVDLQTLTRNQIYDNNLPCISIKNAIADGLMDPIRNWELLDKHI